MARNPYRDIPRPQAKAWFDEIRRYVDGGKIHHEPEAVARLNELCERLWDEIPRLTERRVWWLHRALWFDVADVERFRQEGKVTLSGRPFMSWSRNPKTAANSNGLGIGFGFRTKPLVIVNADIPTEDILVDIDSLGRRAGYKITEFMWNGGEREFIVRHRDPVQTYGPEWVQIWEMNRLEAGDFASIRLDGRMDPDLLARMKAAAKARPEE